MKFRIDSRVDSTMKFLDSRKRRNLVKCPGIQTMTMILTLRPSNHAILETLLLLHSMEGICSLTSASSIPVHTLCDVSRAL